MIQTIWLMWKPGEERKYVMCVQPPKAWADKQKADGFYIASFLVELPDDTANVKVDQHVAGFKLEHAPLVARVHVADQAGLMMSDGDYMLYENGAILFRGKHIAQVREKGAGWEEECTVLSKEPVSLVVIEALSDEWHRRSSTGTIST